MKLHTGQNPSNQSSFQFMGHTYSRDDLYGGIHPLVKGKVYNVVHLSSFHPIKHNKITINVDYKQLIQLFNVL